MYLWAGVRSSGGDTLPIWPWQWICAKTPRPRSNLRGERIVDKQEAAGLIALALIFLSGLSLGLFLGWWFL